MFDGTGSGSYRDLIAWQRAIELCLQAYSVTKEFPDSERFGLVAEIRKTARSVAYNIAEGHRRKSNVEFARFLDIARGSQAEVETQLILAVKLGYLDQTSFQQLASLCDRTGALIFALMNGIQTTGRKNRFGPR